MPVKHEQPTNQAPARYAQVPNQHLPLIDVGGMLHHPIATAIENSRRLLLDLVANTRLTASQRYAILVAIAEHDTVITELRALATHNLYHNDQPLPTPPITPSLGEGRGGAAPFTTEGN